MIALFAASLAAAPSWDPTPLREVTPAATPQLEASTLRWTPGRLFAVTADTEGIYSVVLDAQGRPSGSPVPVFRSPLPPQQRPTEDRWTVQPHQGGYLVAWQGLGVYVAWLDGQGTLQQGPTLVETQAGFPALASDGRQAWLVTTTQRAARSPSGLVLYTLDGVGQVGPALQLTPPDGRRFEPSAAARGGVLTVAYRDDSAGHAEVKIVQVRSGYPGEPMDVTEDDGAPSDTPQVAAHPMGWVVTWQDYRPVRRPPQPGITGIPSVFVQLLRENLVATDDALRLSNPYDHASEPPRVQVGKEHAWIAWAEQSPPYRIHQVRLALATGQPAQWNRITPPTGHASAFPQPSLTQGIWWLDEASGARQLLRAP